MERMKAIKKNRKLHKKFYRAMGGFLITLVLLCAAGGNLFAKYYAGQKNKGVGVASSLYFSSNVLKNVASTEDTTDYPMIFNKEAWNGTDECEIEVDIRNYANQLLYNDKNLDITYQISFQLYNTSDGGNYTVSYDGETKTITTEETAAVFTDRLLQGGKQNQDQFVVSVTRPESESSNSKYRSVGILVTATPVSPSFVVNSAKLGGILYASMLSASYSLDCNFNQVNESLSNYSGFPCTISYTPGEDQAAHEIKIRWKDNLEIDQFDPYYLKAKSNSQFGDETVDDVAWHYIIITMQPYSTIQIAFYRSSGFDDSTVTLSECVKAIDLNHSSEGSGN